MLNLNQYPQLRELAWHMAPGQQVTEVEAFELYERNWRHVDQSLLEPAERALIDRLTIEVGGGVLLV